jgi:hypothetical protein
MITVYRHTIESPHVGVDCYEAHRDVMRAFPLVDSTPRASLCVLWRDIGHRVALVQAAEDCGLGAPVCVYLQPGDRVRARVAVSPLKREHVSGRMALLPRDQWRTWLASRLRGASVEACTFSDPRITRGRKGPHWIEYATTTADLTLLVMDAPALESVIAVGIGKGRSFGLGLVTIEASDGH